MKIRSLFSLKGGVGKTAAAINLAYEAAQAGESVLLWDLDPQGAAGWILGCDKPSKLSPTQVIAGKQPLGKAVRNTAFDRLAILPAGPGFKNWDVALDAQKKPRQVLAGLAEPFSEQYSLLILDCPPGQGVLATAILRAAHQTLVPVVPTPLSLRGLEGVFQIVDDKKVGRTRITPFFSMVDRRRRAHKAWVAKPPKTMKTAPDVVIDYSSHIERMAEHRTPIREFAPRSRAARQYRQLAETL